MAAKQCKHEFQGHKDGVTCMKCGLKMSAKAYQEYLTPKDETKPKEEDKGE